MPERLNGIEVFESSPGVTHESAAAELVRGTQNSPAEIDSDSDGLSDQMEAAVDQSVSIGAVAQYKSLRADHASHDSAADTDNNGIPDAMESGNGDIVMSSYDQDGSGIVDAMESDGGAIMSSWDLDGNKIPDQVDGLIDKAAYMDQDRNGLIDVMESGADDPAMHRDQNGDGVVDFLESTGPMGTWETRAPGGKKLDLTDIPASEPPNVVIEPVATPKPASQPEYKLPLLPVGKLKAPPPSPPSSSGRGQREQHHARRGK